MQPEVKVYFENKLVILFIRFFRKVVFKIKQYQFFYKINVSIIILIRLTKRLN